MADGSKFIEAVGYLSAVLLPVGGTRLSQLRFSSCRLKHTVRFSIEIGFAMSRTEPVRLLVGAAFRCFVGFADWASSPRQPEQCLLCRTKSLIHSWSRTRSIALLGSLELRMISVGKR